MRSRTPFRNNARLILLSTAAALLFFVTLQGLLRKSRDFSPDFLASVLLYGLTVLNISLLLVLVLYGPLMIRALFDPGVGVQVEGINYFADTLLFAGVILALAKAS